MLSTYWIRLIKPPNDGPRGGVYAFGVGVTAYDEEDALSILDDMVFDGSTPQIESIVAGVTYDDLEVNHVRPNVGIMPFRGVWFPKGHSRLFS